MRPGLPFALLFAACLPACGDDGEETASVDGDGTLVTSECGTEERFAVKRANHVPGAVSYEESPPVGGDHDSCWESWGVHESTVAPERWVHNLEHGGVVFLHDCADGCGGEEDNLAELAAFADSHPRALYTQYPGLPGRFAAVSWGRRLVLDCVDVQAVTAFYALRAGNGESPELTPAPPPPECE